MNDPPRKRLARLLRKRRKLSERLRRGAITRDEYVAASRALVEEARLQEPNLDRPWWADDLGWLMRAVAQAVYCDLLREGEHVMFLRREAKRFRRCSFSECQCLAVDLEAALPVLTAHGLGLRREDVDRALALDGDTNGQLVLGARMRVYFQTPPRWRRAVVLDWARVQALGATPRRGDPRSL